MTETRAPAGWLRLQCRPGKAEGHLVFPYEVANGGPLPALVMDAWRATLPGAEAPVADPQAAQVTLRADGVAVVGHYVPAIPGGIRVSVPAIPLCTVLKPGETLARELRLPLPLAETSSYQREGMLRRYEQVELRGLILAIGWWPLAQEGIAAAPAHFAPGHHLVVPLGRLPKAGTAQQRFPTTRLDILKRLDDFPRVFPSHPDIETA